MTRHWLVHAAGASVVLVVIAGMWGPGSEVPPTRLVDVRHVARLAALLDGTPDRDALAEQVVAFARFAPAPDATRALADALAGCRMVGHPLDERQQVARLAYTTTNGGGLSARALSRLVDDLERAAVTAGCSPATATAVAEAARRVARADPNPRADWW